MQMFSKVLTLIFIFELQLPAGPRFFFKLCSTDIHYNILFSAVILHAVRPTRMLTYYEISYLVYTLEIETIYYY